MALASVGRRRRRSGTRPGPPKAQLRCWDEVILRGHPQREQFVSYLRDGVGLYDMWLPPFRGPLVDQPFDPDRFRGATVFPNRMPSAFSDFVENEIDSLRVQSKQSCTTTYPVSFTTYSTCSSDK